MNQNAAPLADSHQSTIRTGLRFSDLARGSQRRESATEISFYPLVTQDPSPLADPGSAGSPAEVSSALNGFDSLDPTQDSYEFDLRQMCTKLGIDQYGRPLAVSSESIVPVTECTSDHIPPVVSEQDHTSITPFSSDILLSPANQLLYAFTDYS